MNSFMKLAKECAEKGVANNEGGPFGAVIVDSQNNLVSTGNNRVIIDNDPTAHAEMVAAGADHISGGQFTQGYGFAAVGTVPLRFALVLLDGRGGTSAFFQLIFRF